MDNYPLLSCRRHDYVKAAMVEAALSIQRHHGTAMAAYLLQEEGLPPALIERILARVGPHRRHLYQERSTAVSLP